MILLCGIVFKSKIIVEVFHGDLDQSRSREENWTIAIGCGHNATIFDNRLDNSQAVVFTGFTTVFNLFIPGFIQRILTRIMRQFTVTNPGLVLPFHIPYHKERITLIRQGFANTDDRDGQHLLRWIGNDLSKCPELRALQELWQSKFKGPPANELKRRPIRKGTGKDGIFRRIISSYQVLRLARIVVNSGLQRNWSYTTDIMAYINMGAIEAIMQFGLTGSTGDLESYLFAISHFSRQKNQHRPALYHDHQFGDSRITTVRMRARDFGCALCGVYIAAETSAIIALLAKVRVEYSVIDLSLDVLGSTLMTWVLICRKR
ncbi:uncharacterized protein HD556DRAFT_1303321 [Suillus plorans]|uniref:Uncharacterized protein n=1 Tax=Suillus plorans TaxID=116603 RepID=A0A9P7DW32_9AGAM|nr:uncharacterized protein HD556DRAFT_1303321 [Suillus plorans]KAG1804728.1 hypothetical protein HD556DRAFT_1303321 [Suillus plorans]